MESKIIDLLSVPSDLGANIRGTNEGPRSLKNAFMSNSKLKEEIAFFDKAEISVPVRKEGELSAKYEKEIYKICKKLKEDVFCSLEEKKFPLILGGDHSLAVGSIFGTQQHCLERGLSLGVLWFDAHADMNTPTSTETGNIHGMPLATVIGQGYDSLLSLADGLSFVDSSNIFIVGVRSIDRKEKILLEQSNISYCTMEDIKRKGLKFFIEKIQKELIEKVDCLHLSFDLDVMDPSVMPSVSTPVAQGMMLDEACNFLTMITESQKLISMDMVEYNPKYEEQGKGLQIAQKIIRTLFSKIIH